MAVECVLAMWRRRRRAAYACMAASLLQLLLSGSVTSLDSTEIPIVVCPGDELSISCSGGHILVFTQAVYGRVDAVMCSQNNDDVTCEDASSLVLLSQMCAGLDSCDVSNIANVATGTCSPSSSYLSLIYTCTQASSYTSVCSGMGIDLTEQPTGFITSPYMVNIPTQLPCTIDLTPSSGMSISMNIVFMAFSSEPECDQHSLTISSSSMDAPMQYCSSDITDGQLTGLTDVTIEYIASDFINTGVLIHYTVSGCLEAAIPIPEHADIVSYEPGQYVTFACQLGYVLSGPGALTCDSGSWMGDTGTCGEGCSPLTTIPNGQVSQSGNSYGSEALYSCIVGYQLVGQAVRTCLDDGTWSNEAPQCQRIVCGHPGIPENGYASPMLVTDYPAGTVVEFTCDTGCIVDGATHVTCQDDGYWDHPLPACILIDCGVPTSVPHAVPQYNSTSYGSSITYICIIIVEDGGDQTLTAMLICGDNATWEGVIPNCPGPATPVEETTISEISQKKELPDAVLPVMATLLVVVFLVIVWAIYHKCFRGPKHKEKCPVDDDDPAVDWYEDGVSAAYRKQMLKANGPMVDELTKGSAINMQICNGNALSKTGDHACDTGAINNNNNSNNTNSKKQTDASTVFRYKSEVVNNPLYASSLNSLLNPAKNNGTLHTSTVTNGEITSTYI